MDLYEQIFYELLEIREMFTANEMFTKCEPLLLMKTEKQERHSLFSLITSRYLQMEYWLRKTYFDPVEAYAANETKESRRQRIASEISSYVPSLLVVSPTAFCRSVVASPHSPSGGPCLREGSCIRSSSSLFLGHSGRGRSRRSLPQLRGNRCAQRGGAHREGLILPLH